MLCYGAPPTRADHICESDGGSRIYRKRLIGDGSHGRAAPYVRDMRIIAGFQNAMRTCARTGNRTAGPVVVVVVERHALERVVHRLPSGVLLFPLGT